MQCSEASSMSSVRIVPELNTSFAANHQKGQTSGSHEGIAARTGILMTIRPRGDVKTREWTGFRFLWQG